MVKKNRNAAEGIDDGKERKKRSCRRIWQRAQKLSEGVGGGHDFVNLKGFGTSTATSRLL